MKRLAILVVMLILSAGVPAAEPGVPDAKTPTLEVTTLDGKRFDLAANRGRWVIVNYWATWCSPCIKEMPALSAFDEAHDDVVVIGLAYEDTERDELLAFMKRHPVVYPIAQIDIDDPPRDFDAPRGLPMTYVIAPDGTIAKRFIGPINEKDLAKITGKTLPATS